MEKVLKLNFTPNTFGCNWLKLNMPIVQSISVYIESLFMIRAVLG